MKYDYIVNDSKKLNEERFHLSCGFYENTSFLLEGKEFYVVIHCSGRFTFYTITGEKIECIQGKSMDTGRRCYMDVIITTTDDEVIFQLPEYEWTDNYPHCDGESDRWDARIIGIRDQIRYSKR